MRKLLVGIGAVVVSVTMTSHAQSPQSVPLSGNEAPDMWFVELSSQPTIEGTALGTLEREEADFHAAAAAAGARYSERRHFRDLWNGLTVRAAAGEVAKLRGLPGVQGVYPVHKVRLNQLENPSGIGTDLITALAMTGADIAQNELGLTGRGVHVGVIDTGVDFDHPDLGGCFGQGCRVDRGFDLVGDNFDSGSPDPAATTPVPDPIPDDCNGHGTHVAGIIGANGGIKGVAPGVKFGAYRVFGCGDNPETTDDIILAAMERARRDRMDVVNMSLGSPFDWPQSPSAKAASRLVDHGVVVVASAGNEGGFGLYAVGTPSVGKRVISVASFENTHANLTAFSISPDNTMIGYIAAAGAPPPPTSGSFPMARTGTTTSTADGCTAPLASLTGKVALIRRGGCTFYQKAFNAQSAGAAGVVLYNNQPGFVSPTVAGVPEITIPVVMVTAARGALIDGRLESGAVTMTWTNQLGSEPNPTASLISSFSSYGLPPDLSFKPDIGAPGGLVRSTLPLERGGYGVLSGTSMSSPHVAGAVALLLQAKPHADPQEVEERLQNSARPHLFDPLQSFLDNVHRQGAGMLQIDAAVQADVIVSPSSLALGEIESGSVTKTLRIKLDDHDGHRRSHGNRHDDPPVTYTLGHEPALATGADTFSPSFLASFATVKFNKASVTLDDRRRGHHHDDDDDDDDDSSIKVTITPPPQGDGARLFGGYITFTPDDGGPVLRVPYVAYNGDYQAIQALTPTADGFPWLAKLDAGLFINQPDGARFTMVGDDVPFFLFHLDHQVANLKMEVFDVATGRSLNFADDTDFFVRNSQSTSFFAFPWDGTTMRRPGGRAKTVPNGTYRIELSVLKALGDRRNPAHTERWTSPNVTIARP